MFTYQTIDQFRPAATQWLWPGRIPLGSITMVEGSPGVGKSLVLVDLAARVTRGRATPEDTQTTAGAVLYVTTEDDPQATLYPRLNAAGADLSRIIVSNNLMLPRDIQDLMNLAIENNVVCVILDPLSAHVAGPTGNEQVMRATLTQLQQAATLSKFAVLLVRHHSKSAGRGGAVYAGAGSHGISAVARSMIMVGEDPSGSGERIFASAKSNLGPLAGSLRFEIEERQGVPVVNWLGASIVTANDLIGLRSKSSPKIDQAKSFLAGVLAKGPLPSAEVISLAEQCGISKRTLERAKPELMIEPIRDEFQGPVLWKLPDPLVGQEPILSQPPIPVVIPGPADLQEPELVQPLDFAAAESDFAGVA